MVQRTYDVDPKLHMDLKTICVSEGTTVTNVLQELIENYVSENKDKIFIKSEETKYRLGIPKLYDDNAKWIKLFRYASNERFLEAWYRLVYLHSLSQLKFYKEEYFDSNDLKLYIQKNPFENTSYYKSLKNLKLPIIGDPKN